ncbi:MAG: hypothetical protein IJP62_07735 [Treponema sp.]|nr:hypothetical protein [Treponema sp.]
MANEPFQMVTDDYRRPLSGKEKAAILLGELGASADAVIDHLDDAELKKLRRAMRSLGKQVNWSDETAVLQETHSWGMRKGLVNPIHTDAEIARFIKTSEKAEKESGIRDMMRKNPDAIAQALSAWLKED